jgi:hypothetical protein
MGHNPRGWGPMAQPRGADAQPAERGPGLDLGATAPPAGVRERRAPPHRTRVPEPRQLQPRPNVEAGPPSFIYFTLFVFFYFFSLFISFWLWIGLMRLETGSRSASHADLSLPVFLFYLLFFFFSFLVGLWFELRASHLQSRCSIA